MLTYGRSLSHIQKGKIHGRLDMGVPIISVNSVMKHIDIDGGEQSVYHLKVRRLLYSLMLSELYIYIYAPLLGQPRQIIFHNHCITIIRGTLTYYYSYTMRYPTDNSVNTKKPWGGLYNYYIYVHSSKIKTFKNEVRSRDGQCYNNDLETVSKQDCDHERYIQLTIQKWHTEIYSYTSLLCLGAPSPLQLSRVCPNTEVMCMDK